MDEDFCESTTDCIFHTAVTPLINNINADKGSKIPDVDKWLSGGGLK